MLILLTLIQVLFSIYAWLYFSIFSHEMGHFCAAKILGLRPKLVKVGSGYKFLQINLFAAKFEFMVMPTGGITEFSNLFVNNLKYKLFTVYLAGSLVQIIFIFILLNIYSRFIYHPLILIFIFIEVGILINNLTPSEVELYGKKISTDGRMIIQVLTTNYQGNLQRIVDLSRYKIKDENLADGLFKEDINALRKIFEALEAVVKNNFDIGIQLFNELLSEPKLSKSERVYILDNLTSIVINYGQKQYLSLADTWSLQAIEIAQDCKTLQGTRGAILVELERFSEGKEMLLPLTEAGNEPVDIFFSSFYIAKADFYLGNEEKVREWLIKAKQTGLFEPILLQLQHELNCFI
ncbi:MAG TPA: site-2 protease family protein [Nostocaceae cyanobacterium]|nr:site-2 protease family protein [Nostocaceae cyanobacterium]